MAIPVGFITRLAIPLITASLLFNESLGPDQVKLYDKVLRAADVALSKARGEGEGPTETFDYIIIGGGSAGAVLANRLSASGSDSVLLLEAGGDPNPISDIPLARRHIQSSSELAVAHQSVPQDHACLAAGRCFHPRAITLGGCSVINGALYNRCNRNDYDLWASFTGDSTWAFENVLKAFKAIENYNGFYKKNPGPNHGTAGEVYVGKIDYIPGADFFLESLAAEGIPTGDLNSGLFSFGYSKVDYNIKDGLRQSSYTAFLDPILDRTNLKIYRYSWATKVHLDANKKAVGVSYTRHGASRYVAANKEIIVSGGVYESPKLLLLSGIGPADHLSSVGIETVVDLPAVGNYLQDHVGTSGRSHAFSVDVTWGQLDFFTDASLLQLIENATGPLNSFEFGTVFAPQLAMGYVPSKLYNDLNWPDIQTYVQEEVVAQPGGGPAEQHIYIDHTLMRPQSYGTVRLASSNPADPVLIDDRFFEEPSDLERLLDGIEYTTNFMLTNPAFQSVGIRWSYTNAKPAACVGNEFASREYWRCFVQQTSATNFHPTSSCRMGPNATVAAVDSKLRVFGTTGLRVIDASVMPFVPSGNTNFPSMMVGQVGAEIILRGA